MMVRLIIFHFLILSSSVINAHKFSTCAAIDQKSPLSRNADSLAATHVPIGSVGDGFRAEKCALLCTTAEKKTRAFGFGKPVLAATALAGLVSFGYVKHGANAAATASSIFDAERFRSWLLTALSGAEERGRGRSLVLYASALALWELVGLSTIPLETAAGMAFGSLRTGVLVNAAGKLGGAMLAYALGRSLLKERVNSYLAGNDVLALVERSMEGRPFRSSLFMRYSVFPELVKNFGLSVMPAVQPWTFCAAVAVHSVPYTILWTALGRDSAIRLQATEMGELIPPNKVLGGILLFTTVFGIVGSPALVAVWIRGMRREYAEMMQKKK